jgi:CheY-like chemotaxis protein
MSHTRIVLVAEDNAADTLLLKRAFSRAGFRCAIIFVENGHEVIEYLKQRLPSGDNHEEGSPALVMVDLAMPKVGGLEVLEWVRQQPCYKQLPVIVFSGLNRPIEISRAYALGANLFVIKTSNPDQWVSVWRRVGEMHGLVDVQADNTVPT